MSPCHPLPVGYLIAADRYLKRDEVGYVTQLSVAPSHRRSLVAAQLLQAQFDRSAYGCRLYCCWCAQDLESANAFWAAMGFTPIAFRTGSMRRKVGGRQKAVGREAGEAPSSARCLPPTAYPRARVHIFWQKRIRAGDAGERATPWWYPSQTGGGALREDRLVFPIPPGLSWRDVEPIVLNDDGAGDGALMVAGNAPAIAKPRRAKKPAPKPILRSPTHPGAFWFEEEGVSIVPADDAPQAGDELLARPARAKPTIDPRLIAMSRELRDRWTERQADVAPAMTAEWKHDVKRIAQASTNVEPKRLGRAA